MKLTSILFALTAIMTLGSCSKEKQLERVLTKQESWNIENLLWEKISYVVTEDDFPLEVAIESGTENSAGTIEFLDEGNGKYDLTITNEFQRDVNIDWEITSGTTFEITEDPFTIFGGFVDFFFAAAFGEGDLDWRVEVFEYQGELTDNDNLSITGTGTIQGYGDSDVLMETYVYEMTFDLSPTN